MRANPEVSMPQISTPVKERSDDRNKLSVLHISTTDNLGGSGRSAYRVHSGLRQLGVRSRMLVGTKVTNDDDVQPIAGSRLQALDRFFGRAQGRLSLQYLFYPSSFGLPWHRWFKDANVVQLYNTHGNYFSHTVLPLISRRRPVVWRLSDMWPMTGHCAYSFECERWKTGCGSCPILSDRPELYRDTTALLWRIKRTLYAHSHLTIVAPSQWIARLAQESPLLKQFDIHVIPNGLNTEVFHPVQRETARAQLGIGNSRRVILFSAESITDRRKGGALLSQALERLVADQSPANILLMVVGKDAQHWTPKLPFEIKRFDLVTSDEQLAVLYSAADVFVLPTLAENLPNGVLESMACGTSPVTFAVGACPEAVRHMETGYVARYKDIGDLAHGIKLLLEDSQLRGRLEERCRQVARAEYSLDLQARRFLSLYQDIIKQGGR
jgi:glycosyltransferase involved in cell wall biosynthesis